MTISNPTIEPIMRSMYSCGASAIDHGALVDASCRLTSASSRPRSQAASWITRSVP